MRAAISMHAHAHAEAAQHAQYAAAAPSVAAAAGAAVAAHGQPLQQHAAGAQSCSALLHTPTTAAEAAAAAAAAVVAPPVRPPSPGVAAAAASQHRFVRGAIDVSALEGSFRHAPAPRQQGQDWPAEALQGVGLPGGAGSWQSRRDGQPSKLPTHRRSAMPPPPPPISQPPPFPSNDILHPPPLLLPLGLSAQTPGYAEAQAHDHHPLQQHPLAAPALIPPHALFHTGSAMKASPTASSGGGWCKGSTQHLARATAPCARVVGARCPLPSCRPHACWAPWPSVLVGKAHARQVVVPSELLDHVRGWRWTSESMHTRTPRTRTHARARTHTHTHTHADTYTHVAGRWGESLGLVECQHSP